MQWVGICLDPKIRVLLERFVEASERAVDALEHGVGVLGKLAERPVAAQGASGPTFPFGNKKGEPIFGAPPKDLRFYANASMRTLNDPAKARFHAKERALFEAYNAELVRQGQAPVVPPDEPEDDQGDDAGDGYDDAGADDSPVI